MSLCPFVLAPLTLSLTATAQPEPTGDKSRYHLFNPTPDHLLRALSPDRPDVTESPYTVDAGHVQIELSFLEFARNGDFESLAVLPTNLKLGLTNDVDLQFVFTPWLEEDLEGGGGDAEGFDDIQLRLKINVWGNDHDDTAFAIMPFVKLPVGDDELTNDHVEGGLILPYAVDLGDGFGLGLMAEFDAVYDDEDDGYDAEFVHTAALGHDLVGDLGGYIEYIGVFTTDADNDYRASLGTGLTYEVNPELIFDFGVNFGLTGDADDLSVFGGMTVRF